MFIKITWPIRMALIIISLLGIMGIIGCGAKTERINLVGSTSVQPLAEVLAERYKKLQPEVSVNVQGGGSSAGIKAALDGTAEIGLSSRQLKGDEVKSGLKPVEIAIDGIAVVVNPKNPVAKLTIDQLRGIFAGKTTNWSAVGGANQPIVVVNREEGSGTRGAFEELVMAKEAFTSKAIVQSSTGAIRQTVANEARAIGYISMSAADNTVNTLEINGVKCTVETVKQKKYSLARGFLFVLKGKPSKTVQDFIDYVMGDGQKVVTENGFVSIK